jgi:hypothetical protein
MKLNAHGNDTVNDVADDATDNNRDSRISDTVKYRIMEEKKL